MVSTDRIVRSKSKKSVPGEDGISYKVLGLHLRAIERLRDIFKTSVRFGEDPVGWKLASVLLIPIGGNDTERLERGQ